MRKTNSMAVMMALSAMLAAGFVSPHVRREERKQKTGSARGRRAGWSAGGCGERECARRRAQIAKGMITESNGLQRA